MIPELSEIHPRFRLNGFHFTREDLKEVAYDLIKEGEAYKLAIGDFLMGWVSDIDTVDVSSSGSTGIAKALRIGKRQMIHSAMATAAFFGLEPGNSALHCLPSTYIAGKMMLVRAMVLGLELDFIQPSSRPLEVNNKSYDFGAMVPMQVMNSLEELGRIKQLIVGGAPVSPTLQNALKTNKSRIYETFGMTETITHIAVKSLNPMAAQNDQLKNEYFNALPGVHLSVDGRNCLIVTAPEISSVPVHSNDVVRLISPQSFEWLGRIDHVINSGGIKIFPEQVERKIAQYIPLPFFVAGIPDKKLGEKLVLLLEGDLDIRQLSEDIKQHADLSEYERPREVHLTERFQWTANGKIKRKESLKSAHL